MTTRLPTGMSLLLTGVLLFAAGCTARTPARPSPPPTGSVATATSSAAAHGQGVFSLSAAQAQEVAVIVEFFRAYNAGQLEMVLAMFASNADVSDCDYRAVKDVEFQGRADVARWLRQRIAEHDLLTVARIADENPDQPVGVVGVEYQRRSNDTLRSLGFPNGITPILATKVVFTAAYRIERFANGPFGGPDEACRPR